MLSALTDAQLDYTVRVECHGNPALSDADYGCFDAGFRLVGPGHYVLPERHPVIRVHYNIAEFLSETIRRLFAALPPDTTLNAAYFALREGRTVEGVDVRRARAELSIVYPNGGLRHNTPVRDFLRQEPADSVTYRELKRLLETLGETPRSCPVTAECYGDNGQYECREADFRVCSASHYALVEDSPVIFVHYEDEPHPLTDEDVDEYVKTWRRWRTV
jgi:hypothetical protein